MVYKFLDAKYDPSKNVVMFEGSEYKVSKSKTLGYYVNVKVGKKTKRHYLDKKELPKKYSDVVLVPAKRGKVGSPGHKGKLRKRSSKKRSSKRRSSKRRSSKRRSSKRRSSKRRSRRSRK